MAVKKAPTLATVQRFLDEVDEWYGRVRKIRRELRRVPRGSEAYLDRLPDLWVEIGVLKDKSQYAAEILGEHQESLKQPG